MLIELETTKKGLPAVWESGGGFTNTGRATIVANPDGSPKRPIYIRRRGPLACENHALFVVREGDLIIHADHHRRDFNIVVKKITTISEKEERMYAEIKPVYVFDQGEWNQEPPTSIMEAVEAAMNKATDYHCRVPYWFVPDQD